MRQNFKVVAVTFAGRKRCMEILFPYITKYKHHIDEYYIYVATQNREDIQYIESFYEANKDFVKLIYHPPNSRFDKAHLWNIAYTQCKDPNTIYLKLDDDIVYIEESLFTDLIDYRIAHPEYLLVYPLIVNNVITSWYLQEWELLSYTTKTHIGDRWKQTLQRIYPFIKTNERKGFKIGDITRQEEVLCPVSWGNTDFCIHAHRTFLEDILKNDLQKYRGEPFELNYCYPMSIQCCAWFGKDMMELTTKYGEVYEDEPWLSVFAPIWSNRVNAVYRNTLVSHYSYYVQHATLEKTDILDVYKSLL